MSTETGSHLKTTHEAGLQRPVLTNDATCSLLERLWYVVYGAIDFHANSCCREATTLFDELLPFLWDLEGLAQLSQGGLTPDDLAKLDQARNAIHDWRSIRTSSSVFTDRAAYCPPAALQGRDCRGVFFRLKCDVQRLREQGLMQQVSSRHLATAA